MGNIVKGIASLFGGGSDDAEKAAKKQEQLARIARDKQMEAAQLEEKDVAGQRPARGRRLLIAPETGETGLGSTLG